MNLQDILFALSRAVGPSGAERGAADAARELLRPYVRSVTRDVMGNLVGIRTAQRRNAGCLLLDAHLDEVSMLVSDHEDGMLKFQAIGIDPRILPGQSVRLCTQPPMMGVVRIKDSKGEEDPEKAPAMDRLRIDCGLTQEQAVSLVPVGTRVVYGTEPFLMGEKTVCGKSMDDRACFVILARVMELLQDKPLPVDVCVLGSVQEEYTAVGASVGAYNLLPDRAIVVDVSFAASPDSPKAATKPLGSGPMIGVGPVMNRAMSEKLQALAKQKQIPYTLEILSDYTGTNADEIQISREGVAVCCVSLPLRYMHTPIETVDLDDIEHCARLIAAYVLSLEEDAT